MLKLFFVTLAAVVSFNLNVPEYSSQTLSAVQYDCTSPQWTAPPAIKGGKFDGQLVSTCETRNALGNGIGRLFDNLLRAAVHNSTVHAGPVAGTFSGLPGYRFDTTTRIGSKEVVTTRQDIYIATDSRERLYYGSFTKSVEASGFAGYLKKIDTAVDLKATTVAGVYKIELASRIVVDKPWYAPGGIFKSKVEDLARERYLEARANILPALVREL